MNKIIIKWLYLRKKNPFHEKNIKLIWSFTKLINSTIILKKQISDFLKKKILLSYFVIFSCFLYKIKKNLVLKIFNLNFVKFNNKTLIKYNNKNVNINLNLNLKFIKYIIKYSFNVEFYKRITVFINLYFLVSCYYVHDGYDTKVVLSSNTNSYYYYSNLPKKELTLSKLFLNKYTKNMFLDLAEHCQNTNSINTRKNIRLFDLKKRKTVFTGLVLNFNLLHKNISNKFLIKTNKSLNWYVFNYTYLNNFLKKDKLSFKCTLKKFSVFSILCCKVKFKNYLYNDFVFNNSLSDFKNSYKNNMILFSVLNNFKFKKNGFVSNKYKLMLSSFLINSKSSLSPLYFYKSYYYNNFYPFFLENNYITSRLFDKIIKKIVIRFTPFTDSLLIKKLEKLIGKKFYIKFDTNIFVFFDNKLLRYLLDSDKYFKLLKNYGTSNEEFFEILLYSFYIKDIKIFIDYLNIVYETLPEKTHKKFTLAFKGLIQQNMDFFIKEFKIRGFYMDYKGKINAISNSKKSRLFFTFGKLKLTTKNQRSDHQYRTVTTLGGTIGLTLILTY